MKLTPEQLSTRKRALISAFSIGIDAGLAEPDELTNGLTFAETELNEAYDCGVNIGQFMAGGTDPVNPIIQSQAQCN